MGLLQVTPWYLYSSNGYYRKDGEAVCARHLHKIFSFPECTPRIRFYFYDRLGKFRVKVGVYDYYVTVEGKHFGLFFRFYRKRVERYMGKTVYVELEYEE
jgi:hypothetical protein